MLKIFLYSISIFAVSAEIRPPVSRIELPVSWQVTRARFAGPEAGTQTESYREVWYLEPGPNGEAEIHSHRARVGVYRAGALRDYGRIPPALVLGETEFARLLGLLPADPDMQKAGESGSQTPPAARGAKEASRSFVTLAIGQDKNAPADLRLKLSEDEHFSIHYEMSPPQFVSISGESDASP